ncbi:MAG: DUF5107 domain-containing protein [Planctomycetes bacterium]|nr:DUF5107 domain-containing protein [Planctomycetota bacterium]
MSDLTFETIQFPSAEIFTANPFIPMRTEDIHQEVRVDDSVPTEDCAYVGKGFKKNCLPHLLQDRYSREVTDRDFEIAVLENDLVKATFSMQYGGRLLSLFDKSKNRELLEVNSIFQPANLAIRNAWFSGGVEWNIGLIGHNAHTCERLFAARVTAPDGNPVLRMYEYERIRKVSYQLDFYLKEDSPFLFVKVRIINPFDHDVHMYWWSNIAVEEHEDVRVLVPADHSYRFGYEGIMRRIETPIDSENIDYSYTTRLNHAMDYFFRLPTENRRWISALDAQGQGLVQCSTDLLKGRKLFVWGDSIGGNNWQDFLSDGKARYLEIQAGLGRTQTEHIAMPPGEWSWLEAYGLMDADSNAVHSTDWDAATQCVENNLEAALPRAFLDEEHERAKIIADTEIDELMQRGSGWGALERIRREKDGEKTFCGTSMLFDDASLDDDQKAWLDILADNVFKHSSDIVAAPITEEPWISKLEAAEKNHEGWYQLGVMYYAEERVQDARTAWEKSLELHSNPFALRCLAIVALIDKDLDKALSYYQQANQLHTDLTLICEYAKCALDHNDFELAKKITEDSPVSHGRIMLYKGYAWLGLNEYDNVLSLYDGDTFYNITDLREGEGGFDKLWTKMFQQKLMQERGIETLNDEIFHEVQKNHPVPTRYNFMMSDPYSPSQLKALGK